MIECMIRQWIFHNTFYDIRSGVNIMSKMADQSIRFLKGIAKDTRVKYKITMSLLTSWFLTWEKKKKTYLLS
jgi:hypothetical protein